MSTELITQLIILATAIVGLYKAATYKPTESGSNPHSKNEPGPVSAIFTGLLSFVGIFAFMLAMPAFVWAFTWITSNIGKSQNFGSVVQYSIPYQVSASPSNPELMLAAASQIPYESTKSEALKKVVVQSLESGNTKVAVLAATAIPYESVRSEQLTTIVEYITKQKATMPNKPLEPTR